MLEAPAVQNAPINQFLALSMYGRHPTFTQSTGKYVNQGQMV